MKNQRRLRRPQQKQEESNSIDNNKFNSDKSAEIKNKIEQKSNNLLANNKKLR